MANFHVLRDIAPETETQSSYKPERVLIAMTVICPYCKNSQETKKEVCQKCGKKVDFRGWDKPLGMVEKMICDNGHISYANQDQTACVHCGANLTALKYRINE
jgi:hypothetical protein